MPCNVVSDLSENLTVLWKKENIDLGQVGFPETERISQDQNYSLHIKNLTFADSGGSPPPFRFLFSTVFL
jgi:hypothetical protein